LLPTLKNIKYYGAEWKVLRPLKAKESLTLLPADKGNAAVVLGTSDYNQKVDTLLQG
jgi:hypothetical protein